MANLTLTYVLWLFGGLFGLHHLYLNRPQHCFIWVVTWGGMVIGWLTEVGRLKEYVDEANEGKDYRERMKVVKAHNPRPGFNIVILGSQLMIGHQLGNVLINAVPQYYTVEAWYGPYFSHLLGATGAALGVHLASNIGSQEAPLLKSLLASMATLPTSLILYNRRNIYIVLCVIVASYVSSLDSRWVTKRKPKNIIGYLKMTSIVTCWILVYSGLWTSNMYHNTRVNTLNGTQIPLREAIYNFAQTQPWDEARSAMYDMIPCMKTYSLDICQRQFLSTITEISDPYRDIWAISVLGFEQYPNQKQTNTRCRKLSSKWHPDRFTRANDTEKANAEKKFLDIQKACGMLDQARINRNKRNTWSTSDQSETVITPPTDVYDESDDVNGKSDDANSENGFATQGDADEYDEVNKDGVKSEYMNEETQNSDNVKETCDKDNCS